MPIMNNQDQYALNKINYHRNYTIVTGVRHELYNQNYYQKTGVIIKFNADTGQLEKASTYKSDIYDIKFKQAIIWPYLSVNDAIIIISKISSFTQKNNQASDMETLFSINFEKLQINYVKQYFEQRKTNEVVSETKLQISDISHMAGESFSTFIMTCTAWSNFYVQIIGMNGKISWIKKYRKSIFIPQKIQCFNYQKNSLQKNKILFIGLHEDNQLGYLIANYQTGIPESTFYFNGYSFNSIIGNSIAVDQSNEEQVLVTSISQDSNSQYKLLYVNLIQKKVLFLKRYYYLITDIFVQYETTNIFTVIIGENSEYKVFIQYSEDTTLADNQISANTLVQVSSLQSEQSIDLYFYDKNTIYGVFCMYTYTSPDYSMRTNNAVFKIENIQDILKSKYLESNQLVLQEWDQNTFIIESIDGIEFTEEKVTENFILEYTLNFNLINPIPLNTQEITISVSLQNNSNNNSNNNKITLDKYSIFYLGEGIIFLSTTMILFCYRCRFLRRQHEFLEYIEIMKKT